MTTSGKPLVQLESGSRRKEGIQKRINKYVHGERKSWSEKEAVRDSGNLHSPLARQFGTPGFAGL
jgi:hypothetical protein